MEYVAVFEKEGERTLIEFPDCPGAVTFAEADEDAVATAREALEVWLETQLEDGGTPARPRTVDELSLAITEAWQSPAPAPLRDVSPDAVLVAIAPAPAIAVRAALRLARQERGFSQAQLAERMGVSRQQVSLAESGGNLSLATIEKIAQALGMVVRISLDPRPTVNAIAAAQASA